MKKKSLTPPKNEVDLFSGFPALGTAVAAILLLTALGIAVFSAIEFGNLGNF